jgi:hypothetical protein
VLDAYERQPVSLRNGDDGFDAVFVTASGEERRVPWRCLPQVVDEIGGPVRSFRSFRGQQHPPRGRVNCRGHGAGRARGWA